MRFILFSIAPFTEESMWIKVKSLGHGITFFA